MTLPPLILPGGGRFKIGGPSSGISVSLRHQLADTLNDDDYVLRWRFSMNPPGRTSADNGPVIQGRIPARESMPFEEGYQFSLGKIGYKRSENVPTFIFALPGVYKVYAWTERISTGETSRTQYCVFELVSTIATATPRLGA
jgi:hypothetical protein